MRRILACSGGTGGRPPEQAAGGPGGRPPEQASGPGPWLVSAALLLQCAGCGAGVPPGAVTATPGTTSAGTTSAGTTSAGTTPPPQQSAGSYEIGRVPMLHLRVPGHGDARVVPPDGEDPRGVVVLLHGSWDRPEWVCEVFATIARGDRWLLCIRGKRRKERAADGPQDDPESAATRRVRAGGAADRLADRSTSGGCAGGRPPGQASGSPEPGCSEPQARGRRILDGGLRWTLGKPEETLAEVEAGLRALETRFPGRIRREPPILAGFSKGAGHATWMARRHPARFPRVMLVEGGQGGYTARAGRRFLREAGRALAFGCGTDPCRRRAEGAAAALAGAGVPVLVRTDLRVGHAYNPPFEEIGRQLYVWLSSK